MRYDCYFIVLFVYGFPSFREIFYFPVQHLGIGSKLEHADKLDQEAHISLLRTKIMPAQTWANRKNLREMVKISGHGFSWPLSVVLPCLFHLHYIWDQWSTFMKPREEILRDFEQVCSSLSQRLGNQDSFFPFRYETILRLLRWHPHSISYKPGPTCNRVRGTLVWVGPPWKLKHS